MSFRLDKRFSVFLCLLVLSVTCCVIGTTNAEYSFSGDADAVEAAADSVFLLEVYDARNRKIASGSGFIIFQPTILATNYHVIEDGAYLIAVSDDAEQYVVDQVCAADKQLDLALLLFQPSKPVKPLEYDASGDLKRSQTVVAIGSPAGLKNTVSIGNISAFFQQGNRDWIQFTAPISAGSSGGVLLNDQGKVIGITTATYESAQNVNLAVRVSSLVQLYKKWDSHTTRSLGEVTGNGKAQTGYATNPPVSSETVWVTASGKKYHNNPNCSKMKSPMAISLAEAIANGYEPCGKCYK